jgi:hypothetical protein
VGALIRWLGLVAVAVAVSLALVLVITSRNLGEMGPAELQDRYAKLAAADAPAAGAARDWLGSPPPAWAMRLAVVWHQARPFSWWWLPILVILASLFLGRLARRRVRG